MAAFTPGDLVVYRVGTGADPLVSTGNAVFLDEYTPSGTLVQSIALPTTNSGSNHPLIASGTSTSEGLLTLSADGRYLILTGYDQAPGGTESLPTSPSSTVPRDVGRVDAAGNIDTSTTLTAFSGNNIRSATSTDGIDVWIVGGNDGVQYTTLGSTTSTQISSTNTNLRQVDIFNGQLYVSSASGVAHLGTVGNGTPTSSGQTITSLPGFPTSGSQYGFFFADLSPGVAGVDTLYVADDTAGGGQVQKFSLVGGSWVANGSLADAAVRGLTGSVNGTSVTLFTTTGSGSSAGGGSLDTFIDTSGYNASITGTLTNLASAPANEAFRGVAFAPQAVTQQADLSVTMTDGKTTVVPGTSDTYTIVVSNAGPNDVTGASVADLLPAGVNGATWTATGSTGGGSVSGPTSGIGDLATTVDLPVNASVTFVFTVQVNPSATGTLVNTATVTPPAGTTDSNPGNNSATDTDTITPQADLAVTMD